MGLKFVIPLEAIPQGRPRFVNGHAVDPPKSRAFKEEFLTLLKVSDEYRHSNLLESPSKFPVDVKIEIYRPASKFPKSGVISPKYGDIDNLVKPIFDAMNGVIWKDDRQVFELKVQKYLANKPMIIIRINEYNPRAIESVIEFE